MSQRSVARSPPSVPGFKSELDAWPQVNTMRRHYYLAMAHQHHVSVARTESESRASEESPTAW